MKMTIKSSLVRHMFYPVCYKEKEYFVVLHTLSNVDGSKPDSYFIYEYNEKKTFFSGNIGKKVISKYLYNNICTCLVNENNTSPSMLTEDNCPYYAKQVVKIIFEDFEKTIKNQRQMQDAAVEMKEWDGKLVDH